MNVEITPVRRRELLRAEYGTAAVVAVGSSWRPAAATARDGLADRAGLVGYDRMPE